MWIRCEKNELTMERMELDILMIRVNMHLAEGRYVDARRILETVLEDEPGHGVAHGFMGWICWVLLDDPQRAALHYRAAIRFAPAHVAHYLAFTRMLVATGRLAELRELHAQAIQVPGVDRAVLHEELATALEAAECFSEAADAFRNAAHAAHEVSEVQRLMRNRERVRARARRGSWIWA